MIAPANPEDYLPSEKAGGGGALFERADNLRSDARLAARMISLGVVTLEQAESLLKSGLRLAQKCTKKQDARGYAACMRIAIECAKLAQAERHKAIDKHLPDLLEVSGTIDHRAIVQELLTEPRYAEHLRDCERDSDPRLIGTNGHKGNGKPLDDGQARNGH